MILRAASGLALLAGLSRWPWTWRYLALALGAILLAGEGPVAGALLSPLQAAYAMPQPPRWQERNLIVVLGAGTSLPMVPGGAVLPGPSGYPRLLRGLALYRDCVHPGRVCRVLVSGGDPQAHGVTEAAAYGQALRALGLPPADLLQESRSLNTQQNATYTARLLAASPPAQIVLVSSGYHLRRAVACFEAEGLAVQPVAADLPMPDRGWLPSVDNLVLSEQALHEWAGLLRDALWRGTYAAGT